MPSRFQTLPRTNTVSAVIEVIRSKIRSGELAQGDTLPPERELADTLGVSRTTLREALRVLKAYGVIETRQKVGATVVNRGLAAALEIQSFGARHDRASFLDIQQFRRLVEVGSMAATAARIGRDDIDELRRRLASMSRELPPEQLARMDFAFHRRMLEIAGNHTVLQVYDVLEQPIVEIMTIGKTSRDDAITDRSHLALLDALEAGDRQTAQRLMSEHLDIGLRYLTAEAGADDATRAAHGQEP